MPNHSLSALHGEELKSAVYGHLRSFCLGRTRAKKAKDIADAFHASVREINDIVRCLRKDGTIIGSAKEPPFGYYIPVTEEEMKDYLSAFRSELFDMLTTFQIQRRAMKRLIDQIRQRELFPPPEYNAHGQMEMRLAG